MRLERRARHVVRAAEDAAEMVRQQRTDREVMARRIRCTVLLSSQRQLRRQLVWPSPWLTLFHATERCDCVCLLTLAAIGSDLVALSVRQRRWQRM
jgi:hypothetical protein